MAALRLPERLQRVSTPYYQVRDVADLGTSAGDRLRGVYCSTSAEGVAAATAGADFLVMIQTLPASVLADLCRDVPLPVFAREISLSAAWESGASGINAISG